MASSDRIGPIAHAPTAELAAWSWLTHSDPRVRARLLELARANGWDANAIAAVIARESAGDPQAQNPHTQATGLIQWMPATAKLYGTTAAGLARMSALRQLDLVERYFASAFRGRPPAEVGDYYLATFMPSLAAQPDELQIGVRGSKVYEQNAGLDANGDGVLDVGDVKQAIRRTYADRPVNPLDMAAPALSPPPRSPFRAPSSGRAGPLVALLVAGGAVGLWWFRRRAR